MKKEDFNQLVINYLQTEPTEGQKNAITTFMNFVCCKEQQKVMLLQGYAGTGKTSLISAFVHALNACGIETVLLAPTGRAAKVLGAYAAKKASTVHREIYRMKMDKDAGLTLQQNVNKHKNAFFFVDEASMLYDDPTSNGNDWFRDSYLLSHLFEYIEQGSNCRLVLIGDNAQLPPVGLNESPALDAVLLKDRYSQLVFECELKDVVRQQQQSDILFNATKIRHLLTSGAHKDYQIHCQKENSDVKIISRSEILEEIENAYNQSGMENTVAIVRTNKQANMLNQAIRNRILWRDEILQHSDLLMNVKNNYYWLSHEKKQADLIANGDILKVIKVYDIENKYNMDFADVSLQLLDTEEKIFEAKIILSSLYTDTPALPYEQWRELFFAIEKDYMDIVPRSQRFKKIKTDPYLNAMQVKFAYAQTCHKTQGGGWDTVFVDKGYVPENEIKQDYYRWLYTAITRAKEKLFWIEEGTNIN
ncbi:MAG: AAA family ATPase [Bacteroidales bacterium]|nr:AAA family ATPase [Bacteroidales bacterium]